MWEYPKVCTYKDIRPLIVDLKRVYAAPTEDITLSELDLLIENGEENTLKLQSHRKTTR
jgi:hypothetical protein